MCTRQMTKYLVPLLYVALTAAAVQSATGVGGARNIECQVVPHSLPRLTNAAALAAASVRPLFLEVQL